MKSIVILILCIAVVVQIYGTEDEESSKTFAVQNRMLQGNAAVKGQFPYMAYLSTGCGGTLIDAKWVLTAAICVDKCTPANKYKVYLGDVNREQSPIVASVSNVYIHPEYNGTKNDIALLELKEPVTFTDDIKAIRLPDNKCDEFVGEVATLAGFGDIDNSATDVLQYTDLKVMTHGECEKFWPSEDDHLCVGSTRGPSEKFCYADSGSGLVLDGPDGAKLIGVTSFGKPSNCTPLTCTYASPDGFTRVNYFLDWIVETTKLDITA